MRRIHKIGVNTPCPCGSGQKYKACCRGEVDWEDLLPRGPSVWVRYLSTRGKNKLFLSLVLEALQIDTNRGPLERSEFKKAFTSAAVRRIYEAVQFVWPDGEDLKRVLARESQHTSGLYIGRYEPDLVSRGITRHSLYADRILLVDPLMHPQRVRDEFNPILHPEQHRTTTLKWISLWVSFIPWIEEGIVGFVRAPGDFYPNLMLESVERTQARFTRHPELNELRDALISDELQSEDHELFLEDMTLTMPDDQIRRVARESRPGATEDEVDSLVAYVHHRRESHPYFLGPEHPGELRNEIIQISSGTNYEQAKLISLHSRSYVMTDMPVRWREIELDRKDSGIDPQEWSPFAKAFQGLPFHFLDSVPLAAALALRKEGRLESMRSFLRKTWSATSKANPFDDSSIPNLTAELEERVRQAEVEWKKIDRDLIKILAAEATTGLLAAGPLVASGYAHWLGAAAVAAGVGNLVHSRMQRASYRLEYPAGFFVDLKKGRHE